ncbi:hypothetical protein Z517_08273 [Fonsecaea pedrosoi CBS 271.37]|uniref:Uncharacterized protein n=1 Tax=Fonsecaea pedrosoi CBS 271.37 TaxID=1442368 RepID=A0A0D2EW16_9EURO|nr:uncharacterized protein Z517_08273 [Fonsecaea pedrosoi CBS 271.37]KIW78437.1 hypothetical protein Z517_08273 [Fonsecaea pedrosoi CBS 271.37]
MLTVARPQDEITAWWWSGQNTSSTRIAVDAYARAVEYFERALAETPSERAWTRGQTSLEDVKKTVERARDSYDDRSEPHARAKRWIGAFAANMARYGAVLDILANADPLHAGLAWGAVKFIFAGVSNYSQHAAELAKALAHIGDVLPRIRRAVTWYTANRTRRVLKAVFRPSQLPFQETVADIELCARNVELIASTAGRAEIRGQSFVVEEHIVRQRQIEQRLLDMQPQLELVSISSQKHEQSLQQLVQHTMNSYDLLKAVKLDVGMDPATQKLDAYRQKHTAGFTTHPGYGCGGDNAAQYHDGILILTTNRVGTFDEAFKSRVQLAIHYPVLNSKDRYEIWCNFIEALNGKKVPMLYEELRRKALVMARRRFNGRQIRNCLWTATQVAKYRNESLGYSHIEQVMDISQEFEDYLERTRGHTDEENAQAQGTRAFDPEINSE